ncbi:hypothetical protein A3J90_03805 [candidate division WOR-1 bacterium RIFOXYC2_FULL_37_10]|uniref:Glucose-6-phosphate isomerase n=1 Tax=candidate division WOR-1 bacterium RIFOXYB2_FULL_37_13 TaxID=1802579 RepID=A0A1F4SWL6_UNCSA|nr:MAG: hypothetical protein A2246_06415 [candidate division WOR-1 bacterium RIFOXYA2_FULL_37_7]OGC24834.1 MAG: hypothetical protein A2310_03745 [candidate division WOR-1 bacterium RIFOXYB2_FULL_37_13]OGC33782.1 MAG: hypothetical protein A3J90_03805 [candidate division WOR-1 bacterium RIFOXYC2_FULL_37_10]
MSNKTIKLDYSKFGNINPASFNEESKKVERLHDIILEGKNPLLKDKEIVMTGWKTESPFISSDKLLDIKKSAEELRNKIDDFVSIGIGGSYLGTKATIEAVVGNLELFNLFSKEERNGIPRIFFLGNHMDPSYISKILKLLDNRKIGLNVISKSGGTVEPAIAFAIMKNLMEKKVKNPSDLIVAITDAAKGALKKLAGEKGYQTFDVPDNVGGRFSVTSPVGLFGLAMAGIDIEKFISGVKFGEEQTRTLPFEKNIAMQRAVIRFIAHKKLNKKIELISTGIYDLKGVAGWMQQLGPESEGKKGEGLWIFPVFYTQDAHSIGQMIQEGERNIIETFLMVSDQGIDMKIQSKGTPVEYLDGKNLSFANNAFVEGLLEAHVEGGVPCMTYTLPDLSAFTIGQLYQIEMNTIALSGLLLGQNPFIQPGVQKYKAIADKKSGR